jgi:hypothetical protein
MGPRDAGAKLTRRVDVDVGTLENAAVCGSPLDLDATRAVSPRDIRSGVVIRCVAVIDDDSLAGAGSTAASGPSPA